MKKHVKLLTILNRSILCIYLSEQMIKADMSVKGNISELLSLQSINSQEASNSTSMEDLTPFGYSLAAVALFGIMIFGCISNLIVIVVIGGTNRLRTPMNSILLNLSVSDFIISAFGTPLSFASALNNKWIFGETLCKLYAFMMTLTGMTSIGTLTAIAIERYIIISRSLYGQTLPANSSIVVIIMIWIYSLIQALPPLFGWNRYIVEHPGIACSLDWQTPDYGHNAFIAYIFILGYILPVFIMSYSYIKVIWILKRCSKCHERSRAAKAEAKVTYMAIAMIICTVSAWTPYAVVSLMVSLGYGNHIGPVSSVCPAIFAKTSVIYNPIIYYFFNSQIREVIVSKIPIRWRRRRDAETEISLETKRGITVINTVLSNNVPENGDKSATTENV
uniref:C-opsin n=1 Tax=Cupiennius salei TaxID=6928 RepID=T2I5B2_CUPSA|nr:c-opsin [Cupiennius salei]